ncbi:hypothetical protein L596_013812 [Steinernema carpocapsae]|uniref:Uncharacterized protein n=1 Tax=Steinernema carpocapsae TaxID=34508 RepID=A0A4U5P1A5_STECR|nr:hypothetical protein L596_013812 [Steinernema carpocapsae]
MDLIPAVFVNSVIRQFYLPCTAEDVEDSPCSCCPYRNLHELNSNMWSNLVGSLFHDKTLDTFKYDAIGVVTVVCGYSSDWHYAVTKEVEEEDQIIETLINPETIAKAVKRATWRGGYVRIVDRKVQGDTYPVDFRTQLFEKIFIPLGIRGLLISVQKDIDMFEKVISYLSLLNYPFSWIQMSDGHLFSLSEKLQDVVVAFIRKHVDFKGLKSLEFTSEMREVTQRNDFQNMCVELLTQPQFNYTDCVQPTEARLSQIIQNWKINPTTFELSFESTQCDWSQFEFQKCYNYEDVQTFFKKHVNGQHYLMSNNTSLVSTFEKPFLSPELTLFDKIEPLVFPFATFCLCVLVLQACR